MNRNAEQLKALQIFSDMVRASVHNLVAKDEDIGFHIEDSLNVFQDHHLIKPGNKVLDIGSGGGFPVIPLSICYPDASFTAVESSRKKTDFLSACKISLKLDNLNVQWGRIEEMMPSPVKYDLSICRAFSHLKVFIEVALPQMKKEGLIMAYKSVRQIDREISESSQLLKAIGGKLEKTVFYEVMKDNEAFQGALILIKKVKATPEKYPRMWKKIKADLSKQN